MSFTNDGKESGTEDENGIKKYNMDVNDLVKTTGLRRKATLNVSFCVKKERNASFKKVTRILQKTENERTEEEKEVLSSCSDVVKEVTSRLEKRKVLKARSEEVEDSQDVLTTKCAVLAQAVQQARHLVVYSGAGVSTAACIPDYRGTNGIWTRLQQGKDIGHHDLSKTQPTLTHMVLYTLYRRGVLKHVVSQNCDGLHLRSGLPRAALSELHGNMYLEVCQPCKMEYWRLFDVTEHTARYAHATARRCYSCHKPLRDTIVHFGERGALKWPLNWSGATAAANQADVILCIGSSLKVLKKYPWLWGMDRPVRKRPSLYIVNLQWTPKDEQAVLKINVWNRETPLALKGLKYPWLWGMDRPVKKRPSLYIIDLQWTPKDEQAVLTINGKCDEVMAMMMKKLNLAIPEYDSLLDPIFVHATRLLAAEMHTYSTAALQPPDQLQDNGKQPNDNKRAVEQSSGGGKRVREDMSEITNVAIKQEPTPPKDGESVSSANTGEVETNIALKEVCSATVREKCETEFLKKEDDGSITGNELAIGDQIKEEVKSENDVDVSSNVKDEAKESSKSPLKGIWRPFLFEDNGSSCSSTAVENSLAFNAVLGSKEIGKTCNLSSNRYQNLEFSKSFPLQDPGSVKKCLVQLEPLDLSCSKKNDLQLSKNHNPFFCDYCRLHYHSGFCLFYRKQSPEKPPDPPCYCCDEEDEKESNDLGSETDTKSVDDSDNKSSTKIPITNPGWFGKGYRKKIRKKR